MSRSTKDSGHILKCLLFPAQGETSPVFTWEVERLLKVIKVVRIPMTAPFRVFSSQACLCWASSNLSNVIYISIILTSAPGILLVRYGFLYPSVSLVFRETVCPMTSIFCGSKKSCWFSICWLFSYVGMRVMTSKFSILYPEVQITKMSIKWWLDKQNVVYSHNKILFSH